MQRRIHNQSSAIECLESEFVNLIKIIKRVLIDAPLLLDSITEYEVNKEKKREASRGARAQSVTVKPTGCGVYTLGSLCLPCCVLDTA